MSKYKVLLVFGTRPETIKMAPLVRALSGAEDFAVEVCVTGQHREMLAQVLAVYGIEPNYDLQIMSNAQTLTDITCRILNAMPAVFVASKPDLVLVHGDTSTALATALAAFYAKLPVAHVEAGLRTYNKYSPYPEEMNRRLISVLADLNFAPTVDAARNLNKMGIDDDKIFVTGNTAIDALYMSIEREPQDRIIADLQEWVEHRRLILLTAHRRENIGDNMRRMFRAVADILAKYEDVAVVYPVHLNPQVQALAQEFFANNDRVKLIAPLDVINFHHLMNLSYLILTDSGGIQEEAPALNKPVLVMRDTTERPEGVEAGTLRLIGTEYQGICQAVTELLDNKNSYMEMCAAQNPYGDGRAAEYIVQYIREFLA